MNKKILISLGSLLTTAIVAPVFVSSCSSEQPVKNNLNITAKQNPVITNEDILVLEGKDNLAQQLTVLGKLFQGEGLTFQNQSNFSISIDKIKKIVTLTAKEGFNFNNKNELSSSPYTIVEPEPPLVLKNLIITPKAKIDPLSNNEISILEGTDIILQFPILQKIFEGKDFKISNYTNFGFTVNREKRNITLTGKNGYKIDGKDSLESTTYTIIIEALNITPIPSVSMNVLNITFLEFPLAPEQDSIFVQQLKVLQQLFNGITSQNIKYFTFTVQKINNNTNKCFLTANYGYVFGSQVNGGKETIEVTFTTTTFIQINELSDIKGKHE
ncbi:MAG: hypothetical protein ACRCRP_00520 [Metamycoplasmataceae bacterium]